MEALRLEITRIVDGFDQVLDEMVIFFYYQQEGSFKVYLNLFENRTLSELKILIKKVSRSTNLNELLRDHLKEFVVKASPQVISLPYSVKFFRSNSLHTCNLDPVSLKDYLVKHLVWIENMLRTIGFASKERSCCCWYDASLLCGEHQKIWTYEEQDKVSQSSTNQTSQWTLRKGHNVWSRSYPCNEALERRIWRWRNKGWRQVKKEAQMSCYIFRAR